MSSSNEVLMSSEPDIAMLTAGPNSERLMVSSNQLKAASKVWAAMFSTGFREGQAVSASNPSDVSMPEDDGETLKILLAIVHMRNDLVPQELSASQVLKLAIMSDKYDCVNGTALSIAYFLHESRRKSKDIYTHFSLAEAAFAARLPAMFRTLTTSLASDFPEALSTVYATLGDRDHDWLSPKACLLIEQQRRASRMRIGDLARIVQDWNLCRDCRIAVGLAFQNVLIEVTCESIVVAWKAVYKIPDAYQLPRCQSTTNKTRPFDCVSSSHHSKPWGSKWKNLVDAYRPNVAGLCLECVLAGSSEAVDCDGKHAKM